MVTIVKTTEKELQDFVPYPVLVKDNRPYKAGDFYILEVYNSEKQFTGVQVAFTIENVKSPGDTKGIKAGYLMLKLKRTKLPAATVEKPEEEAA